MLVAPRIYSLITLLAVGEASACARFEEDEGDEDARDEAFQASHVTPLGGAPNGDARDSSATLLFDVAQAAVVGDGLTIRRLRAFQANPPNFSPAAVERADGISFEVWYEIEGSTTMGYRRYDADGVGYAADASGWLYVRERPPGTLVTENGDAPLSTGANRAFRIATPDSLLTRDFLLVAPEEVPGIVSGSDSFPWRGRRDRVGLELARHHRYRPNRLREETVSLGCVVYSPSSAAAQALFGQIDAGELDAAPILSFPDGTTEDTMEPAGLEEPVIAEELVWMITGINVQSQRLRIATRSNVSAWQNRQLPGEFEVGSTTAPSLSRLEELFRTCHAATTAFPGYFRIVFQRDDGVLQTSAPIFYCDEFGASLGSGTAVPLDGFPNSCTWGAVVDFAAAGTWSGIGHGVPVIPSVPIVRFGNVETAAPVTVTISP